MAKIENFEEGKKYASRFLFIGWGVSFVILSAMYFSFFKSYEISLKMPAVSIAIDLFVIFCSYLKCMKFSKEFKSGGSLQKSKKKFKKNSSSNAKKAWFFTIFWSCLFYIGISFVPSVGLTKINPVVLYEAARHQGKENLLYIFWGVMLLIPVFTTEVQYSCLKTGAVNEPE